MNKKDINKNFSLIDKTQHQVGQWKKIQFLIDQLKLESFSFWFDRKRKYSWKGGRINYEDERQKRSWSEYVHENLYEKMALNVTGESKAEIVHENPT